MRNKAERNVKGGIMEHLYKMGLPFGTKGGEIYLLSPFVFVFVFSFSADIFPQTHFIEVERVRKDSVPVPHLSSLLFER